MKKIYIPGQCYFITTNTARREWVYGSSRNIVYIPHDKRCQILINVLNYTREKLKYLLHSYVIMPDHMHLILSTGDKSPDTRFEENVPANISRIMHAIKGRSARLTNQQLKKTGSIWQEDFYEHCIRNRKDYEEKLNYIHYNPVRAGFVDEPGDFQYSSFRNYFIGGYPVINIDLQ